MTDSEMIKIGLFENQIEAQIVQGKLRDSGIESVIHGSQFDSMGGLFNNPKGTSLWILEEDKEEASEILQGLEDDEQEKEIEPAGQTKTKRSLKPIVFIGIWLFFGGEFVLALPLLVGVAYYMVIDFIKGVLKSGLSSGVFIEFGFFVSMLLIIGIPTYILYRTTRT